MTPAEIHAQLKEQFGDAVAEWQEPEAGDAVLNVARSEFHQICKTLRDDAQFRFDFLRLITAVDWTNCFSSVYHLYSYTHGHSLVLRVDLERETPSICSVVDLWPTAEWLECECYDMMGIQYKGHPNLQRILLPLDWQGYPLRKDYQDPEEYHGIRHG